jgi:hypothetical protein
MSALSRDPPTTPAEILQEIQLAQLAATYPDFPKNYTSYPGENDPNYVAPDMNIRIITTAVVTTVVALALVAVRLWVRRKAAGVHFGLDDWFLIPGALLATVLAILQIVMTTKGGLGRHIYDNSFPTLELTLKVGRPYLAVLLTI